MTQKTVEIADGYGRLFDTLVEAFNQAASGKGYERHGNGSPFEGQPIFWIAEEFGDAFLSGQAVKKIHEARRLPPLRAIDECRGAIVYLAAQIMLLEDRS